LSVSAFLKKGVLGLIAGIVSASFVAKTDTEKTILTIQKIKRIPLF
jgi:hypothetical protein